MISGKLKIKCCDQRLICNVGMQISQDSDTYYNDKLRAFKITIQNVLIFGISYKTHAFNVKCPYLGFPHKTRTFNVNFPYLGFPHRTHTFNVNFPYLGFPHITLNIRLYNEYKCKAFTLFDRMILYIYFRY